MQTTTQVERGIRSLTGQWAGRFIWAAITQGVLAVFWTLFIVSPFTVPSPSRIIAGGGAGTWLFVGYSLYLVIGVVAVAVTAVFYMYIERILGKLYTGVAKYLAWTHLVLMNAGAAGATWLMMTAGYLGGSAGLPTNVGGGGLNPGQIHEVIAAFPEPIFYFVLLAIAGVIAGGLGYLISARSRQPFTAP